MRVLERWLVLLEVFYYLYGIESSYTLRGAYTAVKDIADFFRVAKYVRWNSASGLRSFKLMLLQFQLPGLAVQIEMAVCNQLTEWEPLECFHFGAELFYHKKKDLLPKVSSILH